jgi:hypothetical protein
MIVKGDLHRIFILQVETKEMSVCVCALARACVCVWVFSASLTLTLSHATISWLPSRLNLPGALFPTIRVKAAV